jgi:flagellar hook-basal body complex protein FliE
MDARIASAALAYAQSLGSGAAAPAATGAASAGGGFAEVLEKALTETSTAVQGGEAQALKAATGTADVTDIVTAVTNAELTLETVVAIRDKVIAAYQDIIRMPI